MAVVLGSALISVRLVMWRNDGALSGMMVTQSMTRWQSDAVSQHCAVAGKDSEVGAAAGRCLANAIMHAAE